MLIQHLCEGITDSEYLIHVGFSHTVHRWLPLPCYRWKWGPEGLSDLSRIPQLLQSASNPLSPHITQKPLPTENLLSSQWIGKFLLKQLPTSFCSVIYWVLAAATAKSLQSCPTLCNPRDGSPPGSPVPGILHTRTLEWVAISFSNAWKWSRSVLSDPQQPHGLQPSRLLCPWDFPGKSTGVGCHCLRWCQKQETDK